MGSEMCIRDRNSSLQGAVGDAARERVAGLAFDDENNLWMSNHTAARPISVLKANGEWRNFNAPVKGLLQCAVDLNGYKWFVAGNEGVLVFDDNGTIDNVNDDRMKLITPSNSNLPTTRVNCLEVDLEGAVWVGTVEGPIFFDCGESIFEDTECSSCLLYTSPSPRDLSTSRMPSSA